ncbi:hypothetical protein [Streptomyces sp. NBC_01314]|uniref:hypothetical protein n=1 Tax=Streptomyces sp. NBC_01314 TaxID=2903821 RepID=UPI003089BD1C|nr:hypothetical protein OG622_22830 [Streptomyces sp. NBC_01314]
MPWHNALSRRIRKVGAAARAGLFLVLALIALTLAAPTSASADFTCDLTGDESYHRDSPGSNGESFIPAVTQWGTAPVGDLLNEEGVLAEDLKVKPKDAGTYTLYELNGMRGLNWSMTFKDEEDATKSNGTRFSGADDCEFMTYVNNGMANIIFYGTKVLTRFSISVKEMASNPSPFASLYSGRDNLVKTLKSHVLVPAVPVMIVLVGFWVFTKWRKGDMREVWAGISWTALTTIAVLAFLGGTNNYNLFVSGADKWIAEANSALTSTALSSVSGTPQPPCDLKDDRPNEGLRLSSCAMYDTLAFRPWALGQFGEPGSTCIFRKKSDGSTATNGYCPTKVPDGVSMGVPEHTGCYWGTAGSTRCADLRVRQAVTQSTTNIDTTDIDDKKDVDQFKEWQLIRGDLAKGTYYPVAYADWTGKNATDRMGIAFYSLIAAFIVGVMVIVLSALTLLWHAVTLILIIMLPLIATLGIHPSQQKLLKGWLETFIHSFVLRAGFGVILTVLLVLYQVILPAQVALGTQLLMLILVTAAVVMMLKKLLAGNFSPEFAGGAGDAMGIREAASAGSDKIVAKGEKAMVNAPKASGRVAGKAAKGTAWAVDRAVFKGKGRGKMQEMGWLGQSKREQQQSAKQSADTTRMVNEEVRERREAAQAQQTPPASKGGRVSGSGSKTPVPAEPSTSTAPQQPQPQPQPSTQRPRTTAPEPSAPNPRPANPEPPAAPRPPVTPQAPASPTPPPRDPRSPNGRV